MRVRRKFIQLTKFTYPYGTENQLKRYLPKGYQEDEHGNFFLKIGDNPTTMFTCHLDTACMTQERVTHVFHKDNFVGTDGKTILGADDKAGMVVLLSLIEKQVPGLYYFFIGEEVGCIGSSALSLTWSDTEFSKYIKKCVSFDRRGTDSVITEQLYGRCASDEFATELSNRLNEVGDFTFEPDPTGVLTDSVNFMDFVPECTNISVGYYNEHGGSELQDLSFLKRLCNAVCEIDWETLPIVRDLLSNYYDDYDFEEEEDYDPNFSGDNYSFFKIGDDVIKMYISNTQIQDEINIIQSWLSMSGAYPGFDRIDWNGNYLSVGIDGVMNDVGERYDLLDMIPGLKEVPKRHLKEKVVKQTNNYLL
jgi:hypothetical protein